MHPARCQTNLLTSPDYYPTGKVLTDLANQPGAFMAFRGKRWDVPGYTGSQAEWLIRCPYGQPGDRLWVRETMCSDGDDWWFPADGSSPEGQDHFYFPSAPDLENEREDVLEWMAKQRAANRVKVPAIHMPRWASRILLEIVSVRVERLQDITEADAKAEGVKPLKSGRGYYSAGLGKAAVHFGGYHTTAKDAYADLWEEINGSGSWEVNPWVWVVEFKRVDA